MNSIRNPNVPFNLKIPGGMCVGKMVTVQGTVPSMSQRFAVNFLSHSGDIVFHLCPRFRENCVVRNNVQNMNWGPEERSGSMPIYPGQSFEVIIMCDQYNYKVAFNGAHFTEFNHRVPFNSVSNIAVDGDVIVHNVHFKDPSNYSNNNLPYGFQTGTTEPNYKSGGLYPSAPTPNSSPYPNLGPAFPQGTSYNTPGPQYPSSSPYPQQPNYGHIPHQGPYPQAPNSNHGSYGTNTNSKPGFLDQAGMALAGVLGPGLLSGGLNKNTKPQTPTAGRSDVLSQAGMALANVFGGSGLSRLGRSNQVPTLGPTPQTRSGFLGPAGSALAGILEGSGLLGGRSTGPTDPHHNRNKLGILGGALGTAVTGAALTGHLNPIKAAKKQRKAQKKALKYGLPIAGAGIGAYALHKGLKGFRRSSSSSSSSSD